jgi:hypothetical protein
MRACCLISAVGQELSQLQVMGREGTFLDFVVMTKLNSMIVGGLPDPSYSV